MPLNLRRVRETAEKQAIVRAMSYTEDNISEAASLLGVARPTLYSMLEKYQLDKKAGRAEKAVTTKIAGGTDNVVSSVGRQ